ncbi:MAG TPA: hypothetical protein VKC90_01730 [Chitinophagaceae bacterium]|nr:hypothetical protein [Chitinophagaceae bacterium]
MFTVDETLHFEILKALIKKGYKVNEMIEITTLREDIRHIVGNGSYEVLESLHSLGYIGKDLQKYSLIGASFSLYNSLKWKKRWLIANTVLKYAVGIIGIVGAILTIIFSQRQLRQQGSTNQLIQDMRRLTNQKDSLLKVLEDLRKPNKSILPLPPTQRDTTKKQQ